MEGYGRAGEMMDGSVWWSSTDDTAAALFGVRACRGLLELDLSTGPFFGAALGTVSVRWTGLGSAVLSATHTERFRVHKLRILLSTRKNLLALGVGVPRAGKKLQVTSGAVCGGEMRF